jgi:threonine synthase
MINTHMNPILSLKCTICGKEYKPEAVNYVCTDHGDEGILDVQYDYAFLAKQISRERLRRSHDYSIWRYRLLLPIKPDSTLPPLQVGWTPLYAAKRLASELGLKEVWIKDDGRQATGSFKDRASAIAVVKAKEQRASIITTASTGNAAAALSGLCASLNQPNVIFVPQTAPQAKIAQLLVYGSTVFLVKGSYYDAFELSMQAAKHYGWYNRNTGYNPYMTEGKKTAAYEICEQMAWKAPDRIFVSVGDGCIIGGLHKGLKDLLQLVWIERMPKLMGVQAEGSNYLYQAWKNNEDVLTKPAIKAATIADSISADLPRDRLKALAAVKETNGAFVCVSDEEILRAIAGLAQKTGVFAEPAGAASYAGLVKACQEGRIPPEERIVVLSTGNGLKDISSTLKSVATIGIQPLQVPPHMEDLKKLIAKEKIA